MTELIPSRVRVPCSTSNLGSGYDTIGVALNRYLDVSFEPNDSGSLSIERSGTLEKLDGTDEPDLVAKIFSKELDRDGIVPSGCLKQRSKIPVARGLIFPDFALRRRTPPFERWWLEIVGFWTPEYLQQKLASLRLAGLERLILCIDAERNCSERDLPAGARVVRYRRRVDVEEVLRLIGTEVPGAAHASLALSDPV